MGGAGDLGTKAVEALPRGMKGRLLLPPVCICGLLIDDRGDWLACLEEI